MTTKPRKPTIWGRTKRDSTPKRVYKPVQTQPRVRDPVIYDWFYFHEPTGVGKSRFRKRKWVLFVRLRFEKEVLVDEWMWTSHSKSSLKSTQSKMVQNVLTFTGPRPGTKLIICRFDSGLLSKVEMALMMVFKLPKPIFWSRPRTSHWFSFLHSVETCWRSLHRARTWVSECSRNKWSKENNGYCSWQFTNVESYWLILPILFSHLNLSLWLSHF